MNENKVVLNCMARYSSLYIHASHMSLDSITVRVAHGSRVVLITILFQNEFFLAKTSAENFKLQENAWTLGAAGNGMSTWAILALIPAPKDQRLVCNTGGKTYTKYIFRDSYCQTIRTLGVFATFLTREQHSRTPEIV